MVRLLSIMIECISSVIFVIPVVLIWQYKIAKQKNFYKLLTLLVFVFYIIAVFSVTGIPTVSELNTIDFSFNFIPLISIMNDSIEYIKNAILNIILFMPMGFLLPMIWKEYNSLKKTAITGLILSILI
ncbi:MAG: VanZ family protein, partial [Oscillospiraceae bacterium]|nr:VanZ family protein [Oscillospiraceae bacterium]